MTTLAITAANIAGRAAIQTASALALSTANAFIGRAFDNRTFEGPRLDSLHVQTSRDGAPMSRVYGRIRLAGQVIWASHLREIRHEEPVQSGKGGGPTRVDYSYTISFAIGLCEGEILGVDRLWANGLPLETPDLVYRVYNGTADQGRDPIISAIDGGDVPAFRDTAYIVFEDFPLDGFGGRLPQINAEVIRVPPGRQSDSHAKMETLIKSVSLLPGSGEFAYATARVEETPEPGVTRVLNVNNLSGQVDCLRALDQLQDQLPNCRHVSVIVSWFGTSLRCDQCEIVPAIEQAVRLTPDVKWSVDGTTRNDAYIISSDEEGRPNFGGTPSDASIIQTLRELKQRGFKVTLYPFLLMDIADGPQAFPWRGRITGDEGEEANGQISTFFNREAGFRNFILHYAALAQESGGVEAFIIGSEMRGLTTLRGSRLQGASTYPAVDHWVGLAADVKSIVGDSTIVTYAADWTEYFGHHPQDGSGDVSFHLDPLWSSPHIDAIGIDAYFPLSDWREGEHLDKALASDIYDVEYLQSQIEGGEGYDYYYASPADRTAQNRTTISDGAEGKAWVFRYKDIRNWWSNQHYNRINFQEVALPTAWQAKSKPIHLLEVGCPAVRFGANQPNVFIDPKSSESEKPYFSDGSRDDYMQRRYLEALISYWDDTAHNPSSPYYEGRMIDTSRVSVWTWDARPFPDFPARLSAWSDGVNWQTGHWITGRVGHVALADVVRDIADQSGLTDIDVSGLNGLIQGYHLDRPMSARAALSGLGELYGFTLSERGNEVAFLTLGQGEVHEITAKDLVYQPGGAVQQFYPDPADALRDVRLHFIDAGTDYQMGLASAQDRPAETERILDINAAVVMDRSFANYLCDSLMNRVIAQNETLRFALSPMALKFEVGDRVSLPESEGVWRIDSVEGDAPRDITAQRDVDGPVIAIAGGDFETPADIPLIGRPVPLTLDLPAPFTGQAVGVLLSPFSSTDVESGGDTLTLNSPLRMGAVLTDMSSGPVSYFDRGTDFNIFMPGIRLNAVSEDDVLNGANRFAVETPQGWDFIQMAEITLIGANIYRCATILRGVGSEGHSAQGVSSGARIVWMGAGIDGLDINPELRGETLAISARTTLKDSRPSEFNYQATHLKPLSPVHLKAQHRDGQTVLSWIRRSRVEADSWVGEVPLGEERERYRLRLWYEESLVEEIELVVPYYETALSFTRFDVAQGSDAVGWGYEASATVTLPMAS